MKNLFNLTCICIITLISTSLLYAPNGVNVIGVGPVSRAMGGTGIANPQDGLSAIHSNPSTLIYFNKLRGDFATTFLYTQPKTGTIIGTGSYSGSSTSEQSLEKISALPAFSIVTPIGKNVYFGIMGATVAGLQSDYRTSTGSINIASSYSQFDLSPAFAMKLSDVVGVGFSFPFAFQSRDFGKGSSSAIGMSGRLGLALNFDIIRIGVTYKTPALITPNHKRAFDTDGDGMGDYDIKISPPSEMGIGISLNIKEKFTLSINGKAIFWSSAKQWEGMKFKDQYVIAVGSQLKIMKWLTVRAGYNYGSNPMKNLSHYDPSSTYYLQGFGIPASEFYTGRALSALTVLHHVTMGIGIDITKHLTANLSGGFVIDSGYSESSISGANMLTTQQHNLGGFSITVGVSSTYQ